ncbi:Choline/Carnitine o-acyltransferase-domain-containing protein [Chiua virens]|nr:Choline/Carnitine o-acyltransferase-domain-containing protein [Chiua virens]
MSTPVQLYVYDLSNGLARQLSLQLTGRQIDGIWHTSVVVFGKEILYGQGIAITQPGKSHFGAPLRIIDVGETAIDQETFNQYLTAMRDHYTADKVCHFNCNSFTNDCIGFLTGGSIPSYITCKSPSLPSDFLSTPFGAALRPTIDAMFMGRPVDGVSAQAPTSGPSLSGARAPPPAAVPPAPDAPLAAPMHITTNPASFQSVLRSNRAVVAFFTSATSKSRPGGVGFAKIDLSVGMGGAVASAYQVRATPTFVFFLDGNKTHVLLGVNPQELRTQVDLLIYQAFPPHPHTSLSLLAIEGVSLSPILYAQVPNLDTMFAKLVGFIDGAKAWTGAVSQAQVKQTLSKTVLPFLKASTATPPSPVPTSFEHWPALTMSLAANLGPNELFPMVDIWRLALLNASFAAWNGTKKVSEGPLQRFVDKMLQAADLPRNYVLTVLRMLTNTFSNQVLAREVILFMRAGVTKLLVDALLHEDAAVRTAAGSLGFNMAAYLQRLRMDKVNARDDRESGEESEEWEIEIVVAVLGAIERETSSEETVHRLVACLGLLLRLSPYTEQLRGLLETLRAGETLKGKLKVTKKKEVRRLITEVADELCFIPDIHFLVMLRHSIARSQRHTLVVSQMAKRRLIHTSAQRSSQQLPEGYVEDHSAGSMLRFQASLPHLPVPPLTSTIAKYLESVQPHLTPAEYASTRAAAESFLTSPLASKLQARLEARAQDPSVKNWLADWWNEVAYMGYRDPVVVFVSYFYVHLDDVRRRTAAGRAARLIKALLPFRAMTESKQLEPEKVRGVPLCMDSYKWLFHACRYPVKSVDTAAKFDPATHDHVVFVRKNKFFEVSLASPEGRELSAAELEVQIERVIELAGDDKGIPVGALTSENRDVWTDARVALLAASPVNGKSLERIESAAIVVCLDDTKPVTREDISWACWVGDGRNRFYDKHQLLVFDNGRSGFLGEHSCMDGTPTLRLNEFMLGSLAANKVDLGPGRTESTGAALVAPAELRFELDTRCQEYIDAACRHFDELVGAHQMEVLHYEGYGKELMKTLKVSPDAWAQLVKQLAFHKMFNRPAVTYESCQTRKYQQGRTEVIRSASNESKAWVEAMVDPDVTDEERARLFRRAIARHLQYAAWASEGQGVDRHLFGLKRMLRAGEDLPGIYTDGAFSRSSHWELSTSQLSSKYLDGWGYGEVVPDGYGLSYSIDDGYVRWTITSVRGDTAELKHYLAEAATETRDGHVRSCRNCSLVNDVAVKQASETGRQKIKETASILLKLKCDRVFPCQSCSKRGCAEICPDGALTSGKGSRFILANTEQLHGKIIQMSDRIRQLEDALGSLQSKCASDSHPLLNQDLLRIKNSLELYNPHAGPSRSHLHEDSIPSSFLSLPDPDRHSAPLSRPPSSHGPVQERSASAETPTDLPRLSPEIEKLSQTFPYPWLPNNPMRDRIYSMLPSREEAEYLCSQARLNALWQYNLDPSETWLPNLVHHVYTTPVQDLCFRRLSLLFIMMSIGLLVDLNQQSEPPRAELYHRLARASLCEMNLMDEPNLDLIQTLFYMIWYLLIFSDKSQAVAYAWSIMGLAVKLAQSVSPLPHRDGNRWKVIPEESQRRRMLFWELLNLDARLALSLGRPPSICLDHVDCRRPSYAAPEMFIVPGAQSYHEWKHGFFLHCLTPVLTTAISAQPQPYQRILDVDKIIRHFTVPPTLDIFNVDGIHDNRQLTMQQVLVSSGREIVLLQLHRNSFTEAVSDSDAFSYRHKFAPSAVATYLSSSRLIATLKALEEREPQLSKRFMCFWFNAFSGAVALSLIVSRTPFLSLAPFALQELDTVHRLFAKVAEECPKVAQALPLLTKIAERSRKLYAQWRTSAQDTGAMDIDQGEKAKAAPIGTHDGSSPFATVHPDLTRCLQGFDKRPVPSLDTLSTFVPQSRPTHFESEARSDPVSAHDLSTDMLALALGRDGDLIAVRTPSQNTTTIGPQRVGNHTFNFDFGALASNVENSYNTYMSWF